MTIELRHKWRVARITGTRTTGYTGQYGYRGPVMHSSEYIGGRMARDILAEPGLYVALVVECEDDETAGWLVAYRHGGGVSEHG